MVSSCILGEGDLDFVMNMHYCTTGNGVTRSLLGYKMENIDGGPEGEFLNRGSYGSSRTERFFRFLNKNRSFSAEKRAEINILTNKWYLEKSVAVRLCVSDDSMHHKIKSID